MRSPIHAFFAVLAAVATLVGVFAIKRGTEWGLSGLSDGWLAVAVIVLVLPFPLIGLWLQLRPLIERRKQRKDAGLR